MFVIGKELMVQPVDALILMTLFHQMDTNPREPYISHEELAALVQGKSEQPLDEILDDFQSQDEHFLVAEKVTVGSQEAPEIELYYTLTIAGLRWLLSNTRQTIEIANSPDWEFPDFLIAKLWSRRIERDNFEDAEIPAADRYVSVKDNQGTFDEISDALTVIKNEFAKDHLKLANSINGTAVMAEIEAFELQIKSNWVSKPAAQNFLATLKYVEAVCASSKNILIATTTIAGLLILIFG